MKGNALGWFEIYVEDMDRAKRFYQTVFDVKLERLGNDEPEMWSFPGNTNTYGASGALVKMPKFQVGKNSVLIYFSSADCTIEEKRIKENGGKIEKSKFSIAQYGYIAIGYDTERNMLGLHSMK